jgi:hypothetical protein
VVRRYYPTVVGAPLVGARNDATSRAAHKGRPNRQAGDVQRFALMTLQNAISGNGLPSDGNSSRARVAGLTDLSTTGTDSRYRRRGRVAEGGGLLNRYTV